MFGYMIYIHVYACRVIDMGGLIQLKRNLRDKLVDLKMLNRLANSPDLALCLGVPVTGSP